MAFPGARRPSVSKRSFTKEYTIIDKSAAFTVGGEQHILCPECGMELTILQHPTVCDGLPYVKCGAQCTGGDTFMVVM